MANTKLQAVTVEEAEDPLQEMIRKTAPPRQTATESAIMKMLPIVISGLSQRALIAVASLVDLALISSVFVLWLLIIGEPTVLQLVGVGGYAAFILASILVRKR